MVLICGHAYSYTCGAQPAPPRETAVPLFRQRVEGRFLLWLLHEQHGGGDLALVQGTHLQSTPPSSLRRPSAVPVILPLLCLSPCLLASVSTRSVSSDAMVISSCYCSRCKCIVPALFCFYLFCFGPPSSRIS